MKTRKILIYVATAVLIVALGIFGYIQYTDDHTKTDPVTVSTVGPATVNPFEHVNELDKQAMYLINENYAHFETNYMFSGTVDSLETADVVYVANIFQIVENRKPTVFCYRHYPDGSTVTDKKVGAFWVEDFDLSKYEINLTIDQAFDALMKANCPKPRSKYCTLRAAVGPVKANPQYIFGNDNRGIVWVDATTGEVRTSNPTRPADEVSLQATEMPAEWQEFIFTEK